MKLQERVPIEFFLFSSENRQILVGELGRKVFVSVLLCKARTCKQILFKNHT